MIFWEIEKRLQLNVAVGISKFLNSAGVRTKKDFQTTA